MVVVGRGLHGNRLWGLPVGGGEGEASGADRDRRAGRGCDGDRHVGGWDRLQVHRVLFSGWVFFRDSQLCLAEGDVLAVGIDHGDRDCRGFDRVVVRAGDGVGDGGARVVGVGVRGGAHLDGLGDVPVRGGEGERGGVNDRAVFVLAGVTVTVPVGAVCRRIVYLPPGVSPSVIDSACGYTCTPIPSAIVWPQVTAVPSSRELQLWAPQPM